jgi:5-methylcytosine-specific restriction enzyme subunit McrC
MPQELRQYRLTESQFADLELSVRDVALVRHMGKKMVSTQYWWGTAQDGEPEGGKSVIQLEASVDGRYRIKVMNMIGVIRLADSELYVTPKIPIEHFFYLAQRSTALPRTCDSTVLVEAGITFPEVLARWCLDAAEALLRQGLRLDYREMDDELSAVRGHVLPLPTTLDLLRGRPFATCRFDELSEDTPLNRVVRAACQQLSTLPFVAQLTRARARRVAYRFNCSALQPADLVLKPDRLARGYSRAWTLAALVLRSMAISLNAGNASGTTFLIRTPEVIEEGLRLLITDALPTVRVAKRRLLLGHSALSVNPDLTFDENCAVGDIKYREFSKDWNRSDLYQTVSFATAFRARHGIVVGFSRSLILETPPSISLGDVSVTALAWSIQPGHTSGQTAQAFMSAVQLWWSNIVFNIQR